MGTASGVARDWLLRSATRSRAIRGVGGHDDDQMLYLANLAVHENHMWISAASDLVPLVVM